MLGQCTFAASERMSTESYAGYSKVIHDLETDLSLEPKLTEKWTLLGLRRLVSYSCRQASWATVKACR